MLPVSNRREALHHHSDQVHILGSDLKAHYIAHAISGLSSIPPVRLLSNRWAFLKEWKSEGHEIHVFRNGECSTRNTPIVELMNQRGRAAHQPHIDNLIVTLSAAGAVKALSNIAHRIDQRTTLCLIQDGLGVAEHLNQKLFTDPAYRPRYVLGHMTHILAHGQSRFSVNEKASGRLCLTALREGVTEPVVKIYPPVERHTQSSHLLRMLTTTPNLQAGGYSYAHFLRRRLPDMVFTSAVDSVSAALDMPYDKVWSNLEARRIVFELLREISEVITSLPELQYSEELLRYVHDGALQKDCRARLRKRSSGESHMLHTIRWGRESDIDFLNGYFVQRGAEAGLPCATNKTIITMVKARQRNSVGEIDEYIPVDKRKLR